ncbi:peptide-binding protein [Proteinivorax tanatarense]|uniref:Peptide-binding protein n=1 Tax=Proteinivorax tanatarense TaxID=1260629 RepID=A0AAU7VMJ7_9FIRM
MCKKVGILFLATVVTLSLGLGGCSEPAENGEAARENNVLTRGIWTSPPGILHPGLYTDAYDAMAIDLIYNGMLSYDPFAEEYVPDLAEEFDISDDELTMTFTLREDLYWHDGEPVTTEDVQFTFEFIADPDYTGVRYSNVQIIEGMPDYKEGEADEITGINVIDDRNIEITLSETYAPALSDVGARQIIPKHIWGDVDIATAEEQNDILQNPVGTGPFKMDEFARDQHIRLVKFEDYHKGEPKLDGITLNVTNQETAQAQLAAGELDFMDVSEMSEDTVAFFEENGKEIDTVMSDGYQHMAINTREEAFADKRVRQGIAYALDRQSFVDDVLDGYGQVSNVPLPSFSEYMPPADSINQYERDLDKAIELFEEAGWEYNEDEETMYIDGEPAQFTLIYPSGNVPRERSATVWQQDLAEVGIEIELEMMDFDTMFSNHLDVHDFDMALTGWSLTPDPDARGIWHSEQDFEGGFNFPGFVNDRNDELLEEGTRHMLPEDRVPIYEEWGQLMNEHLPSIFLYSMEEGRAYTPDFKGHNFHSFTDYHDVHKWYLEE